MTNLTSGQSHRVMFIGRIARQGCSLSSLLGSLALTGALLVATKPLYSQNDALRIDDKGNVGIGTQTPSAPLEVNGDVKVNKSLTVGSGLTIGPAPKDNPTDLFSRTALRLTQATGGQLMLQYLKTTTKTDAGTNDIHRIGFADSVGNWITWSEFSTNNTYVRGNLGVGIEPRKPKEPKEMKSVLLTVDGDVMLGKDAGDYAPASSENLRMVRGTVDENGKPIAGAGFTVAHPSTGEYRITFANPFSGLPSATANQLALGTGSEITDNALIGSVANNGMTVYVGAASNKRIDRSFSFIVMGPR
jgi:hypothetical protein